VLKNSAAGLIHYALVYDMCIRVHVDFFVFCFGTCIHPPALLAIVCVGDCLPILAHCSIERDPSLVTDISCGKTRSLYSDHCSTLQHTATHNCYTRLPNSIATNDCRTLRTYPAERDDRHSVTILFPSIVTEYRKCIPLVYILNMHITRVYIENIYLEYEYHHRVSTSEYRHGSSLSAEYVRLFCGYPQNIYMRPS